MLRRFLVVTGAIILLGAMYLGFGPGEPVDDTISFDAATLGEDIDTYLASSEEKIPDLKNGTQKQVIWAHADKRRTALSIVYIHGFSATLEEIRPLPDLVAADLGANLFFTRLTGHGRSGEALAQASVNDWLNDTAEALAVGRKIGERIILMGTSTGGTFASLAATRSDMNSDIAGVVLISPNYGLVNPASTLLNWGGARSWLPIIFGDERSFEPSSEDHAKWWTTSYPTTALLPMSASVQYAAQQPYEDVGLPALFIFHPDDAVVDAGITQEIAGRWGANTPATATVHRVTEAEDTHNHVIAGRVLSPSNSKPLADKTVEWVGSLK